MKVTITEGSIITEDQAVTVANELRKIESAKGAITPESVVDVARPKRAPLHEFFTWDDVKAGDLYRLEEARKLIRSVKIIPVPDSEKVSHSPIRAFVSVDAVEGEDRFDGTVYMNTVRALSEEGYREQVLQKARRELVSWKQRYEHLKEFAEIITVIESVTVA